MKNSDYIIGYQIEELIPIVTELTQKYCGYDNTSVTYEKAQQLMEAVIYCINEYENSENSDLETNISKETERVDPTNISKETERVDPTNISKETEPVGTTKIINTKGKIEAKEAYKHGRLKVIDKVKNMKKIYHKLIAMFNSYDNICLNDTILKGIPEFLKWYDVDFQPQNTILTLDYPILMDLSKYSGIDAVYKYVKSVYLEQCFLMKLDEKNIKLILMQYCDEYKEMIENICSVVLHRLLTDNITKNPMYVTLTVDELEEQMRIIIEQMISEYYQNDKELMNYLGNELKNIAVRLYN